MTPSDQVLLHQWTEDRDADAFTELVRRHSGMVHATAARILHAPSEAEEVAQECFIKLAKSGARIERTVAGWLHAVATREALDALRSKQRREKREAAYGGDQPAAAASAEWNEVRELVDEAIDALPAGIRDVVVAHYLEGRTYPEIAGDWNMTRAAVAMRASRGVAKVREHLTRKGVVIPVAALAAGLASQAAHAAPQALVANLGEFALSGGSYSIGTSGATTGALTTGAVFTMNNAVIAGAAAVIAVVLTLLGGAYYLADGQDTLVANQSASGSPKIGVYDSRSIAVAFVGSRYFQQQIATLETKRREAQAAGDVARVKRIEDEGGELQRTLHRQGFSTAPVEDILIHVEQDLAAISDELGLEAIVSKWDEDALARYPGAERVDVTMRLVDALEPSARQRNSAEQVQESDPVPLEELESAGL